MTSTTHHRPSSHRAAKTSAANAHGRLPASPSAPPSHFTPARVDHDRRGRFNPIRRLTLDSLSSALDAFHAGNLAPAALLWEAMERRDDVLQGVAAKRKKAVARLDWEILTLDDSPAARRHRTALEYFYNNLTATHACEPHQRGGTSLLIKQMLDALGKKYAVHEIVWERRPSPPAASGVAHGGTEATATPGHGADNAKRETRNPQPDFLLTATFRFAPLWFFEARTGALRFLPDEFSTEGAELPPGQWLVTAGDGLMESCSIAYLFKHLPLRDWLVYCERNGMPGVRGVTDSAPGTPEWEAAREAVRDFGAEFHALMSRGTEIEAIDVSTRGELPYPALVERMDRAMAALWRGADLSTISKGQGLGASLQSDETNLLERDDTALVSETLNAQVDAFVLRELFGGEAPRAYFRLKPDDAAARLAQIEMIERLVKLGVPVGFTGLHERFGVPAPLANEPTLTTNR